nr:uncharacterized protein LOC108055021 [Drosophila takahashii]
MSKQKYTDFLTEDDPLLPDKESLEDKLAVLQNKLDEILENQNQILTLVCQVARNRTTGDQYKVEVDYFPGDGS